MPAIFIKKGIELPPNKINLAGFPSSDPAKANKTIQLESHPFSRAIKIKIGAEEISVDAKTLLKAVATLTPEK